MIAPRNGSVALMPREQIRMRARDVTIDNLAIAPRRSGDRALLW